jgi:predicted TIM-barrel fold metal-dependent hydrolase
MPAVSDPTPRIVDADGHVLEHPTAMLAYMPAKYQRRCFHVEADAQGTEWCFYDDLKIFANRMALAGAGGMTLEERQRCLRGELRYTEIRSGAFDPQRRLVEMAQDSIEQAVVYPTQFLGISSLPDLDFAEAQARAYNRWIADYCAAAPKRLFGIAAVPQTEVERAIRVISDARELGHVGVFLRPNPSVEGRWFCDASYDRLWAALQDLDLAVGFHPFLMPDMPGAVRALRLHEFVAPGARSIMEMTSPDDRRADGTYGNQNIFFTQALGNVFDMQLALTMLICGGVLERFPRLRCIFLEANGGWIVPMLERLDHHHEIFRWEVPQLTMKPSEYFRRQCWISFDPDESTLRMTAESGLVGADRIIWASDYPHPDAKIPGVVGELRRAMDGLPAGAQERILGLNAVELYGLPEPG